ncbi:hypothetical protein D9M68_540470 [compost metagenome]
MGDSPARLASAKPQLALIGQVVDLEHHAVDLIRQCVAFLAYAAVIGQALFRTLGQLQFATDRQAPALQGIENIDMRIRQLALHLADAIATEFQRTAGGDLRIQLTQAAGSGIARIGEGLAAAFQLPGVKGLEAGLGHVHLATHFEHAWPATALQLERDVADGAHIDADVLASAAVATGGAAHQQTIPIQQADRQAIELGLAAVLDLGTITEQIAGRQIQAFAHAAVEIEQVGLFEGVAEAEHRHFVPDLAESRQRHTADALGR